MSIRAEALDCAEISNALLVVLRRRHHLQDVERCPRHVVPHHLEVDELEQGPGLDICIAGVRSARVWDMARGGGQQTHVLVANFGATFFQAVLDVLLLVAFVVPNPSYEVIE